MKQMLLDAIVGVGYRSTEEAMHYTKRGLMRFTGNQHNESWAWELKKLSGWSEPDLFSLYHSLKQPLKA